MHYSDTFPPAQEISTNAQVWDGIQTQVQPADHQRQLGQALSVATHVSSAVTRVGWAAVPLQRCPEVEHDARGLGFDPQCYRTNKGVLGHVAWSLSRHRHVHCTNRARQTMCLPAASVVGPGLSSGTVNYLALTDHSQPRAISRGFPRGEP